MQEQVNERTVSLVVRGTKLTGRILEKAMRKMLADMNRPSRPKSHKGKQTVKQLIGQGAGVSSTELNDSGIRQFERSARKYGVDFALKKDASVSPPKWVVFFKARDSDALMAAIKEFKAKTVKRGEDKPSLLTALRKMQELVRNRPKDKIKNKDRGREL